ncbi:50S ribosomal protein L22 [Candidatus Microgenomates bacterium]|nr:50S ribosomal protein L22 [Candidatus Microgenomates bacterium]
MTIQRYIHTSPRKLRLVADMVRKMEPTKALNFLEFTPKYAAKPLYSAIKTALANAKQRGIETEKLSFKKLEINESIKMRRYRAGTRGRVKPYKRRMSHIKIVLSDDLNLKSQMSNVKTEKENLNSSKEVVVDDSADKTKSTEGGMTESSK